jgi:hypothetical protein
MDLRKILKKLKIQKINLVLYNANLQHSYNTEIDIPLTLGQFVELLNNEIIQSAFKKYLDVIEIYLEYPENISEELKEKINNNKIGEVKIQEIKVEYWENEKKIKDKIEYKKYKDLVYSYINDEDFLIYMYCFNQENLAQCIKNLENILKEGGIRYGWNDMGS